MYYIGIDLGGTNIKVGVVSGAMDIIASASAPTDPEKGGDYIIGRIIQAVGDATSQAGLTLADIHSVGVGSPGHIDEAKGIIRFSGNLHWRNFPLVQKLAAGLGGMPVYLGNDANVAALGEYLAGSAKNASSAAIITLGTGVGAGIIIDGKIISGCDSGASEMGHMVIQKGGRHCTCGRDGCWEAYSSATGLINMSREAMDSDPESAMWEITRKEGKVSGRTAFLAAGIGDQTAQKVVDEYISYLACGIGNLINILQPEIVSLGGGISKEGENLLAPLREEVKKEVFGGHMVTDIRQCTLGNDAGIIGAAMLGT